MAGIRFALTAVLSAPDFLLRGEAPGKGDVEVRAIPLDEYSLATRLSYFLWSSMPDEELSALADSGRLLEGPVLQKQFERMLDDSKSDRFIKEFCGQWLDLEGVNRVAINPTVFKNFDNRLKSDMVGETQAF